MPIRFSLRLLFLATLVVAAVCYWLMLPTVIAQRFVRAVEAENYEHADSFFREPNDVLLRDLNDKHRRFEARAELDPWSWRQLLRGERLVRLYVAYGDAGPMRSRGLTVVVIRGGLLSPLPTSGGGVGPAIDVPLTPKVPTA